MSQDIIYCPECGCKIPFDKAKAAGAVVSPLHLVCNECNCHFTVQTELAAYTVKIELVQKAEARRV